MPRPDVNLEVGSGSHAVQTAEVMRRFEPVLDAHRPSCVLVVGDVNSTLACTLVAVKKGVPVAHVEAGLRSFDRSMPEEINRVLTDQIADLLYTTERAAHDNLAREGVDASRAHFVGNVMIDSLLREPDAGHPAGGNAAPRRHRAVGIRRRRAVTAWSRCIVRRTSTMRKRWARCLRCCATSASGCRWCWRCIRARAPTSSVSACGRELSGQRIAVLPPQGYLEMLGLMSGATLVLTDSGGMQEETTALGVPCLTLRENTERPITIEQGTNTLVGRDRGAIERAVDEILAGSGKRGRVPELWDGRAAERIAAHLAGWLARRHQPAEA